jgi:hypothetical protein
MTLTRVIVTEVRNLKFRAKKFGNRINISHYFFSIYGRDQWCAFHYRRFNYERVGILYETEEFPIIVFATITVTVVPLYIHCTDYGANASAESKFKK